MCIYINGFCDLVMLFPVSVQQDRFSYVRENELNFRYFCGTFMEYYFKIEGVCVV